MCRYLHLPRPYSYYVRHGYGIYGVRNKREAKALYDFCLKELSEEPIDKVREEIYHHTLALYKNNFETKPEELRADLLYCKCGHCDGVFTPYDIWAYVNEHAGWYWS